jgi:hypothetical protein
MRFNDDIFFVTFGGRNQSEIKFSIRFDMAK